uniref:NAD(P)H-quinone oxidoreductase subunit 5, chloroplastic n=1 Tax=Spirogyra maxima TaxID=3180 RepID=A0A191T4F5_SPIMX|nr:subunit 5 of NADH-plastoquinone oxidoreductase [Spirogyra maxima]ANI25272.1 subunit 5 of NADH-plastoquinone oxidoreductase [Spirogyra maxima]
MQLNEYAWIVPILPCLSAAVIGIGLVSFRDATRSLRFVYAILSISMLVGAMILSFGICWEQFIDGATISYIWPWIKNDLFNLQIGYLIDPLSAIMLVLVTTVGVLVMIYSDGYMSHDQGYVRFFGYLSLFTASMLGLVLSPNLVQVYIFWELVGMCSYLLVGFWFTRPSAAQASQKAFITNRVGDFGLLLGILGLYITTGSFDFTIISQRIHDLTLNGTINFPLMSVFFILFFMGPIAKSAQFPLHVWLPDAMEGPTPISALIHAATMVAAGIFLVARVLPIFQQIPFMMDFVAWTGGCTAFLGASIALVQRDLKKGLAYSTMSQLGYMMLALGIGSYKAGIFHLITHAYSKALLFLGSGSVIHAMEPIVGYNPTKSQDMGYMGGLRKYMPITGNTFLIGTLSLCGIPPFACFWSKDEILANAWTKFPVLGWLAWITAGITAFYMFRMYLLTFEGNFRGNSNFNSFESLKNENNIVNTKENDPYLDPLTKNKLTPHESTLAMTFPLVILSIPTILIGLLGAPLPSGIPGSDLLSSYFHISHISSHEVENHWIEFFFESFPSVSLASIGALIAYFIYGPHNSSLRDLNNEMDPKPSGTWTLLVNGIYNWSKNRAYIDLIYNQIFVLGTRALARFISLVDQWIIDGAVNTTGLLTLLSGESTKYGEGGKTTSYIFGLALVTVTLPIGILLIQLIVA